MMRNFANYFYIFATILLCPGHKTLCGAQKPGSQKAAAPKAKKEFSISGSGQNRYLENLKLTSNMSPDQIKHDSAQYAVYEVEQALLELYGKEMQAQGKTLPTLSQYQQSVANALKKCDEGEDSGLPGEIATKVIEEKLNKLSPADIKSYYEKIKANVNAYPSIQYYWPGGVPPYADNLSADIKGILYNVWWEELRQKLSKQPIATLKAHPHYKKIVANCKESVKGGPGKFVNKISNPYVRAVHDLIQAEGAQKAGTMTKEERQKYHEEHTKKYGEDSLWSVEFVLNDKIRNDILQKMATEYTIKSDNPYILEAVKKAQNRTLFDQL